jgi:putative spermidine/putrescine transport system substrate-binding protein
MHEGYGVTFRREKNFPNAFEKISPMAPFFLGRNRLFAQKISNPTMALPYIAYVMGLLVTWALLGITQGVRAGENPPSPTSPSRGVEVSPQPPQKPQGVPSSLEPGSLPQDPHGAIKGPIQLTWSDSLEQGWQKILLRARGSEVRWTMWGGSANINQWVDQYVKKEVKKLFDINLIRQPVRDPGEFINKILTEKKAGLRRGSADMTWINGENFKLAKNSGLLFGPLSSLLPSYVKYYDHASAEITLDFGTPVDGLEAPYGKAQFVFVYDSAKVKNPPQSFQELKEWVKKNPGKFTYPAPPDFTGSAFVRQAFYAVSGGHSQYFAPGGVGKIPEKLPLLWAYLNELKPNLWASGKTYPESSARLNQMFADGEVLLTMGYSPTTAEADIRKGLLPKTVRTFVMAEGTLANTHFLAIPFNASNTDGALVVINFLLSPEAQFAKFNPNSWGDFPALDTFRLDPTLREQFAKMDLGVSTLPLSVLMAHRVPELPPESLVTVETEWLKKIPVN